MSKRKVNPDMINTFRFLADGKFCKIQKYVLFKKANPNRLSSYKWETLSSVEIVGVPFIENTITETRTKSWLGNGIQQDDINCFSEYKVTITKRVYDSALIKQFARQQAHIMGIEL